MIPIQLVRRVIEAHGNRVDGAVGAERVRREQLEHLVAVGRRLARFAFGCLHPEDARLLAGEHTVNAKLERVLLHAQPDAATQRRHARQRHIERRQLRVHVVEPAFNGEQAGERQVDVRLHPLQAGIALHEERLRQVFLDAPGELPVDEAVDLVDEVGRLARSPRQAPAERQVETKRMLRLEARVAVLERVVSRVESVKIEFFERWIPRRARQADGHARCVAGTVQQSEGRRPVGERPRRLPFLRIEPRMFDASAELHREVRCEGHFLVEERGAVLLGNRRRQRLRTFGLEGPRQQHAANRSLEPTGRPMMRQQFQFGGVVGELGGNLFAVPLVVTIPTHAERAAHRLEESAEAALLAAEVENLPARIEIGDAVFHKRHAVVRAIERIAGAEEAVLPRHRHADLSEAGAAERIRHLAERRLIVTGSASTAAQMQRHRSVADGDVPRPAPLVGRRACIDRE